MDSFVGFGLLVARMFIVNFNLLRYNISLHCEKSRCLSVYVLRHWWKWELFFQRTRMKDSAVARVLASHLCASNSNPRLGVIRLLSLFSCLVLIV